MCLALFTCRTSNHFYILRSVGILAGSELLGIAGREGERDGRLSSTESQPAEYPACEWRNEKGKRKEECRVRSTE